MKCPNCSNDGSGKCSGYFCKKCCSDAKCPRHGLREEQKRIAKEAQEAREAEKRARARMAKEDREAKVRARALGAQTRDEIRGSADPSKSLNLLTTTAPHVSRFLSWRNTASLACAHKNIAENLKARPVVPVCANAALMDLPHGGFPDFLEATDRAELALWLINNGGRAALETAWRPNLCLAMLEAKGPGSARTHLHRTMPLICDALYAWLPPDCALLCSTAGKGPIHCRDLGTARDSEARHSNHRWYRSTLDPSGPRLQDSGNFCPDGMSEEDFAFRSETLEKGWRGGEHCYKVPGTRPGTRFSRISDLAFNIGGRFWGGDCHAASMPSKLEDSCLRLRLQTLYLPGAELRTFTDQTPVEELQTALFGAGGGSAPGAAQPLVLYFAPSSRDSEIAFEKEEAPKCALRPVLERLAQAARGRPFTVCGGLSAGEWVDTTSFSHHGDMFRDNGGALLARGAPKTHGPPDLAIAYEKPDETTLKISGGVGLVIGGARVLSASASFAPAVDGLQAYSECVEDTMTSLISELLSEADGGARLVCALHFTCVLRGLNAEQREKFDTPHYDDGWAWGGPRAPPPYWDAPSVKQDFMAMCECAALARASLSATSRLPSIFGAHLYTTPCKLKMNEDEPELDVTRGSVVLTGDQGAFSPAPGGAGHLRCRAVGGGGTPAVGSGVTTLALLGWRTYDYCGGAAAAAVPMVSHRRLELRKL